MLKSTDTRMVNLWVYLYLTQQRCFTTTIQTWIQRNIFRGV
jgi:hypothetical protein